MSQTLDSALLLAPHIPDKQLQTLWQNLLQKHEVHKCRSTFGLNYFITGLLTNILSSSTQTRKSHIVGGYKSASLNQFVQILIIEPQPGQYQPVVLNFQLNTDIHPQSISYNGQQLMEMIVKNYQGITKKMMEQAFAETKHIYIDRQNVLGGTDDPATILNNAALGNNDEQNKQYKVNILRKPLFPLGDIPGEGHTFYLLVGKTYVKGELDHRLPSFRVSDWEQLASGSKSTFLSSQMHYFYRTEKKYADPFISVSNWIHGSNVPKPVDFLNYMHGALAAYEKKFKLQVVTQTTGQTTEAIYAESTGKKPIVYLCGEKQHSADVVNELKNHYEASYEFPHRATSLSTSILVNYVHSSTDSSVRATVFELPAFNKYSLSALLKNTAPTIAKSLTFPLALKERLARTIVHYGRNSLSHFILGQLMMQGFNGENLIFVPDNGDATSMEHTKTFLIREGKSCIIVNVVQDYAEKLNAPTGSENERKIILPDGLKELGIESVKVILNLEVTSNPQVTVHTSTNPDHNWVHVLHTSPTIQEHGPNIAHYLVLHVHTFHHNIFASTMTDLTECKGKFMTLPDYSPLEKTDGQILYQPYLKFRKSLIKMNIQLENQGQVSALLYGILRRENTIVVHPFDEDSSIFKVVDNNHQGEILALIKADLAETVLSRNEAMIRAENFQQKAHLLIATIAVDEAANRPSIDYLIIPKSINSQQRKRSMLADSDDLAENLETKKARHGFEEQNVPGSSNSERVAAVIEEYHENRQTPPIGPGSGVHPIEYYCNEN